MKHARASVLTRIALLAALTCILSVISLPIGPVPVTLAVLAVFWTGLLLSPGPAALCMGVYLFLGCVGLPVFAGMQAGFGVLLGPTGGFLLAYPAMAAITSALSRGRTPLFCGLGMVLSLALCYGTGTLWFAWTASLSPGEAFSTAVLPFLLPDLVKAACAMIAVRALPPALRHSA